VRALDVTGEFALIIVPMQTIQLLADADERRAALAAMARHLTPRGVIALAIIDGDPGQDDDGVLAPPLPDVAEIDGWVYSSLPVAVRPEGDRLVISRLRQIVTPDGDLTDDEAEISLAVLDPATLEAEAAEVGLRSAGRRNVAETDLHVASAVVLLEADS
jgi:hypothetical protein